MTISNTGRSLWLRHETKPFEKRTPLTPSAAKKLIKEGHRVIVESSPTRVFADEEYHRAGCIIRPSGAWKSEAPPEALILGLKELDEEEFPLVHRHIYFAHAYKGQAGAKELLARFKAGGGKLYDLEYLTDTRGRRVAAFGVWAGFVGAALGLRLWLYRNSARRNEIASIVFESSQELLDLLTRELKNISERPRALVIGHRGRCGRGAVLLLQELGIECTKWGSKETKSGGPFQEVTEHDILINAALITGPTAPFVTRQTLAKPGRLKVISDVSCDPTGPYNPLPIYSTCTTMDDPVLSLGDSGPYLTAIDHLPTLLPAESSEDFSDQLMPHLLGLMEGSIEATPWERSLECFYQAVYEAQTVHTRRADLPPIPEL